MKHDHDFPTLAEAQAELAKLELQQGVNDRVAKFAVALVFACIIIPAAVRLAIAGL